MATEQVVEHVAEGLEGAARGLDEAAQVTRQLDWGRIGFGLTGLGVGLAFGFYVGYRFNREKIRAEILQEAERDIAQIRSMYQEKFERMKPASPEEVVEERGYRVEEVEPEPERPTKPPVPVQFPKRRDQPEATNDGWDYNAEIAKRDRNHPYVIHRMEFEEDFPEYTQLQWTYYANGNVLLDERDELVVRPELVVGEANLKLFGHGSEEANTVYIRNDRLEIEWEITRTFNSYEATVLGLDENETDDST